MDLSKALDFRNSLEWHQWLRLNHNVENEAWLIIYKKRSAKTGIRYDEALEEALCFGWIDGKMQSVDEDKFVLRFSLRKANSVWSKTNKEKANLLIEQGRMTDEGLAKIEEAKKNGLWDRAYTSRVKDEIPHDLEVALQEDKEAWTNFHNFANSYRNNYIYWINRAKGEETRKKRISIIVERSRQNKKPGE